MRRLEAREVVGGLVALSEGSLAGGVVVEMFDLCWALMAPALRSERRIWPFARRWAVFESEAQRIMGARGRVEMKDLESRGAGWVVVKRVHC